MPRKKQLARSAFLKRIKDTIRFYDMLDKGDRVLAAVSGGPDSICLLKVLLEFKRAFSIEVAVLNMDHVLRGEESKNDSEFVKAFCESLGVECICEEIDVRARREKGLSIEEAARKLRYEFFQKSAVRKKFNVIATGHTMDDQAETVLMRFIQGTSLTGIAGIPPLRHEGDVKFIRPLIRVEKKEIILFLQKEKIKYVQDSSNLETKFTRNKIRREVMPFLEKYNPSIKRTLVNFTDALREDIAFIKAERKKIIKQYVKGKKKSASVLIRDILLQPGALRKEILKALFAKAGGNVKKLTYRHWMDMDRFLITAEKGKSLDLPGKVMLLKTRDKLVFEKSDQYLGLGKVIK
ncbi:MAG: tRNA lysidine(34) synthetase TilS [Candidatus Omnitrophota bacterium]